MNRWETWLKADVESLVFGREWQYAAGLPTCSFRVFYHLGGPFVITPTCQTRDILIYEDNITVAGI